MIIPKIIWERVEVICPADPALNTEFKNCYVVAGDESVPPGSLTIREIEGGAGALYSKLKITSLSPEGFEATACYWCSPMDGPSWETPVAVKGYF
jgi:hypothetical protein